MRNLKVADSAVHQQGLEIRTTDDRKGYVPMAHRLSRKSDPDQVLDFVLRVLK